MFLLMFKQAYITQLLCVYLKLFGQTLVCSTRTTKGEFQYKIPAYNFNTRAIRYHNQLHPK